MYNEEPKPKKEFNLFEDDMPFVKKRLSKSKNNRIFFGVCAGLADYYDVSKTLVRLLFALTVIFGGLGAIVYFILFALLSPENVEKKISYKTEHKNAKTLFGIILIIIGFYSIVLPTNYFPVAFLVYIPMKTITPVLFLIASVWIQRYYRLKKLPAQPQKRFYRPIKGKLLLGVCSGLAEYFQAYVIVVRLLFVVFTFITMGVGILLYLLIVFLSKEERVIKVE